MFSAISIDDADAIINFLIMILLPFLNSQIIISSEQEEWFTIMIRKTDYETALTISKITIRIVAISIKITSLELFPWSSETDHEVINNS